ncbi:MAG: hypothetical protein H6945_12830 [Zoogloeaceae bacterium]|nr:hypothetical protein [Rhodocyclaceae bacterium]MCP5236609.1 hypothetical protein [Zoogloeaceae bacterium]
MRSLQVFIITLCLVVGLYLTTGRGFFMPGRWDPSVGIHVTGWSARMLGAGLLVIVGLGVVALKNFGGGIREHKPLAWHRRYFAALILAIALIGGAFVAGDPGPTPGWRVRGEHGGH